MSVAEPRSFYTPKTLAETLRLSERTIRRWLAAGLIPSYRVGSSRRIDAADVEEFLRANRNGDGW